ncbi:hypothetical protein [Hellea balneolensis]|uniref:hypothetical protein n=1 Tax=Hellea balneolensis TaxID=287478 RepID=UPI0003F882D2|nr:hypothetical protein [Hellea balneolensis]
MTATLPFPDQRPPSYIKLGKEPVFEASKHLALGPVEKITTLGELGYSEVEVKACPSDFGVSTAFRILSREGVAAMHEICMTMYDNRNVSIGTGLNRLGSYVRGAGYRSQFIKDFCDSPELADYLSNMAGVHLARHSVPAVACGVNYAPKDIRKAVDTWHVDSVAFDIVMMISDPQLLEGGEFQYFHGTKMEGQRLLGIEGEEGLDTELPPDRTITVPFPAAGYGFMQQGNMIFHRACRLKQKAERITMIPSFVVTPSTADDATNSVNMLGWDDPGLPAELTRHEAWRASARLEELVKSVSLHDDPEALTKQLDDALAPLLKFRNSMAGPRS